MQELEASIINESNQFIKKISYYFSICPNLEKEVYKYKNSVHNLIEDYHKIDNILKEFGIPCNIKGYKYLKSAINILRNEEQLISEVYKTISIINRTTSYCVERSIRHAIEVGYSRCSIDIINRFFPKTKRERPTNSEYIKTIISLIE